MVAFARPRWTTPCLAALARLARSPKGHKRIRKLFRITLPRAYKHHDLCGPRFALLGDTPHEQADIVWDNKVIGKTQSLSGIQHRHAGETCFVVGSGPSINELDLTRLQGQAVMGVNGSFAVLAKHGVRPRHHTITDFDFFENRHDLVSQVIESKADCFFSSAGLRAIAERSPELLSRPQFYLTQVVNRLYGQARLSQSHFRRWAALQPDLILPNRTREDDSRVGWSQDIRLGVFCSRTILFRALQIAAFLGYRRIHVLGMDLNYKGPQSRAYDEGANARPTKIERDFEPFILPAFQVLQQVTQHQDLEIYNLSSKSRLPEEVMPRLSFDEALASASTCQAKAADKHQ